MEDVFVRSRYDEMVAERAASYGGVQGSPATHTKFIGGERG